MLPTASPAYMCCRCLASTELSASAAHKTGQLLPSLRVNRLSRPQASRRTYATAYQLTDSATQPRLPPDKTAKRSSIRHRLLRWEAENPSPVHAALQDLAMAHGVKNSITRAYSLHMMELEQSQDNLDGYQPLFEGDDMVDLRSSASDVQAGDLIELSSDTQRVQVLAICLGNFDGYQHFYTNTGKWFVSYGARTLFVVKKFVERSDLQNIVDALPTTAGSPDLLNVLQDLKAGPSREVGSTLLRKMEKFQNEARLVYQASSVRLDNAYQRLCGNERIMSLTQIADVLLHPSLRDMGKFSSAALYAVHTALMRTDVGIRPASVDSHVKSYLYEIAPERDVRIIARVESWLQDFRNATAGMPSGDQVIQDFVFKARKAIDNSRASREWSPYGILKTSRSPPSPILPGWTADDIAVIDFMHQWSALRRFGQAARHHWIGAAILRALDRYEDVEYLTEAVGWTFLQEIGWIKPWEIQSRYHLHLPGVDLERGGGVKPVEVSTAKLETDVFAGRRKDFEMKAFCIDAESATDIDDGFSLERDAQPGQYWIHVHVADPGSRIGPETPWAKQAASLAQTTYLHGHFARMFGDDAIREAFSLANGRPCLTFSAMVSENGELLQYRVTPATLRNVTYITPEVVSEACGEELPSVTESEESFVVGTSTEQVRRPSRPMATPKDLSAADVDDLKTLTRLATRLHQNRLEKGAVPVYNPRATAEVLFDEVEVLETPDGFMHCGGDPSIRISYGGNTGSPLVSSVMQLAGEVAARWCKARGIPVPYRVQPRAAENAALLRTFTTDVFYPKLKSGQPTSNDDWRMYLFMTGGTDISSTPAPNFSMGIDMYTKATSPLRRYADLLVHWQIEGALLHEMLEGQSLIGNKDDSFFPFSRAQLEKEVFPMLRVRERHARLLDQSHGNAEWMLQALLRAWKFGEGTKLPKTFRFTVNQVIAKQTIKGTLNWFDRQAILNHAGMAEVVEDGACVTIADVKVGDVFEVELSDINVYMKRIMVKALKRAP